MINGFTSSSPENGKNVHNMNNNNKTAGVNPYPAVYREYCNLQQDASAEETRYTTE